MRQYKDIFKIKHNDLQPEKGKILISEPFLQDAYFQRAVVLLVEHNREGSMGFVVNKPTELILNDFFPELKNFPRTPIYLGGPVSSNRLFFIHSLGTIIPGSMEIDNNLFFDGDFDVLKNYMLSGNPINEHIKFFMGYSGWTKDQLNGEIIRDSWLVSQTSYQNLFLARDDSFWKHAVEQLGRPYTTWTNFPKNPEMN